MEKKVFACVDFRGRYPVTVAAVVIADSKEEAEKLLLDRLEAEKLPQHLPFTVYEIYTGISAAYILAEGDY